MKAFLNRTLLLALSALALAGCGGRGDSSTDGGTDGGGSTATAAITVQILDASGSPTSSVTSSSPATVKATVTSDGSAVAGVVVTFSTSLGSLEPTSGTRLTDANGVASITLNAGTTEGAGTVKASVSVPSTAEGSASFSTSVASNSVTMMLSASSTNVSAGGTTSLTATLTNSDSTPFATSVPITFSSPCTTAKTATLDSPVSTTSGTATSTYLAKGCVGDDTITATANVGTVLTKTVTLTVASATVGSIRFDTATPSTIAIKGTGGAGRQETSTVKFQVLDAQSNPVANSTVNFSLDTSVGGITIAPTTANSDSNGFVQTVVGSGTVATAVKVTAVVNGTNISTQSDRLVISTGIPDQDSFTLSVEGAKGLNPYTWEVDGVNVKVTAFLADAFNNPVPDGTTVQFTTEGGSIAPSCQTMGGNCSVNWTSQNPRPIGKGDSGDLCVLNEVTANFDFNADGDKSDIAVTPPMLSVSGKNPCGQSYGGRVTILATAIGEESFPDTNGNGRFDTSEENTFNNGADVNGNAYDLSEAFVDHNEDGVYLDETGAEIGGNNEEFADFNSNGTHDTKDDKYNGVLCGTSTICSTQKTLNVRASMVLVMSSNALAGRFVATDGSKTYDSIDFTSTDVITSCTYSAPDISCSLTPPSCPSGKSCTSESSPSCVAGTCSSSHTVLGNFGGKGSAGLLLTVSDFHNQPIPFGSTVKFTPGTDSGTIPAGASQSMLSTNVNGAVQFGTTLVKNTTPGKSGVVTVEVTTPGGTTYIGTISVQN